MNKIAVVGGHIAPALGFINELPQNVNVFYIGRKHAFEGDAGISLEYKAVTKRGITFYELQTGRLQRVFTAKTIPSLLKIPQGFFTALSILKKEKPDIIVSFGGYLSLPVGLAAKTLGIKLILHESTLGAGLANKILSKFADKICVSWDSSLVYFPSHKTIITGNPMLPLEGKDVEDLLPVSREKLPLLMIVGGSAGSHAINMLVMESLPKLLSLTKVIHQTGDAREFSDFEKLESIKIKLDKKMQQRYVLTKFIAPETINSLFDKADIVVSRAGFNTVMTMLILKKKTILIPLLSGQKNEQLENAKLLEQSGYGIICDQDSLSGDKLEHTIRTFLAKKVKPENFSIPVYKDGGANLVKEVLRCLAPQNGE